MDNLKESIDQIFAESKAMKRPRSTYVYSLASFNATSASFKAITIVSTNNRFLQHVDHKFLAYTNMKMANHLRIPVIQFVADGEARFSQPNDHFVLLHAILKAFLFGGDTGINFRVIAE